MIQVQCSDDIVNTGARARRAGGGSGGALGCTTLLLRISLYLLLAAASHQDVTRVCMTLSCQL